MCSVFSLMRVCCWVCSFDAVKANYPFKEGNYRKSVLYTRCDVINLMTIKQNRLRAKTSHWFIFLLKKKSVHTNKNKKLQTHTSVVRVPSGRWQSCPVQESWPPSAAVGIMPPVSPSLSSPQTFPHQPAGTERDRERQREGETCFRTAEMVYDGIIQGDWVNMCGRL